MVKQDIPIEACVAFDLETCLIRPGLTAPPIVCATIADAQGAVFVPTEGVERAIAALLDSDRIIVGHNVAYDFCCILEWLPELRPAVFRAYEADRILDTLLCQRLIEIETGDVRGRLALDLLCARYGLRHETKGATTEDGESVRLSYGRYLGASLEAYPPEFISYVVDDAKLTLELFRRMLQRGLVGRADLARLCRADLGLKLVAAEGLRCDPERVGLLEQATAARRDALQKELLAGGLLRTKRGGEAAKQMWAIKRAVAEAFELPYEVHQKTPKHQPQVIYAGNAEEMAALEDRGLLTEKGNISTGRETLDASGDPLLEALAEYGQWSAVWNKDLPAFRFSAESGLPLHTRFGFAATTRTTSGGGIGGIKFNCFDGETEILTPEGWTRFDQLDDGVEVAQWEAGQISFVQPLAYQRQHYCGDMLRIKTQYHIDLLVTPDHRCLLESKGRHFVVAASQYPLHGPKQLNAGEHRAGKLHFWLPEMIMLCAYQADGRDNCGIQFSFKKERKIRRFVDALACLGWECHEHAPSKGGNRNWYLPAGSKGAEFLKRWLPNKKFEAWVLQLDWESLCDFCNEIWEWDGCSTRKNHYASEYKQNADFVQAALSLRGWRARMRCYRGSVAPSWQVDVTRRKSSKVDNRTIAAVPWNAKVYCVTVPSGFIVIRRGQSVMITGQSQNVRKLPGLRECFVAPDGGAFVATDFTGLENATFAQICLWGMRDRTLVDRYNDPAWDDHSEFGRHIAGRGEDLPTFMARLKEPAAKECRAAAKPLRFGLRGGLRKPTTVASYARIGYGVDRPVEFWASMIDLFFATQHSDVAYLTQYVQQFRTENGRYNVPIPATGIIRRGCGGPAAANTPFQGLGAVVATEALYCTTRDQMLGKMPGRACLFVHDEIGSHTRGSVHPDDVEGLRAAHEHVMIESARRIMPDIIMRAESVAMRHWSKKAEHAEDSEGRIVVQDAEYAVKAERKQR